MPGFEFRSGGRRVTADQFFENLKRKGLDALFGELERRAHGAAASIVDPATGRHSDVFVNRVGDTGVVIRTRGSPAYGTPVEGAVVK